MSINFIISFNINSADLAKFTQIMQSVKTQLPTVDGCNNVNIYQNQNTNCHFTLVENWHSKTAHQTHIQNLTDSGEWAKIEQLLSSPPQGHYYHAI